MMDPFDQKRITAALTGAAIDPSQWTDALETVATCTGSYGAILFPILGNLPIVNCSQSMQKSFDIYVKDGWMERDERYLGVKKFLKNGVATDDDCMPVEARKRSPFYQDFLAACNLKDFAGVRVGRGDLVWNISLQRTPAQGSFSATELEWLAQLTKSLDSVVQISAALGMAKADAALDAFDFSHRAAILLDRMGRVVRVNAAAEQLIGEDIQISGSRVRSPDPHANERLNHAIKALLWSYKAAIVPPVIVPKVSGGKLVIYPMRLPGLTSSPLSAFHAILVVSDTDIANSATTTTLKQVFDLTTSEAQLAAAIATGKDLETVAIARQISKETVRNQLKSVFLKTGANRQAQLAAMLSSLIPEK
jgi:DNA-binding CsgD family transcriptional regulator